jgi:hypothetical protein
MVGRVWGSRAQLTAELMAARNQSSNRRAQGTSLVTYIFQQGFTFHHLPSKFESIKGLNHLLGQNFHDLIIPRNSLTDSPRGVPY